MGSGKINLKYNFIELIVRYKILLLIISLIIPSFVTRLIGILGIIICFFNSNDKLSKQTTFIALLLIFLFAYVYSPYWNLFEKIYTKIIVLIVILVIAIFWSKFSSSEIKINFKFKDKIYLVILTILLFVVNYNNLVSDIAWRGDEDYHISSILNILIKPAIHFLQNNINIFFMTFFVIIGLIVYYKYCKNPALNKSKIILYTVCGFIIFLISYIVNLIFTNPDFLNRNMGVVIRYPFLMKWVMFFFVFPIKYDVLLYRFVPFLSVVLISWFLYYKIYEIIQNKKISMLLSFAFTTIPILFFFSSIVYLEMPLILLMIIFVFDIKSFVELKVNELFKKPAWYCLLFISFIKETSIIIIILFIIIRFLYQLLNKNLIEKTSNSCILIKKKNFIQELRIYIVLLIPIVLYFFFRILGHDTRPYGFQIQNLINFFSYSVFFKALFHQFGIVIIISLIGLILGLLSKDRIKFILSIILFIGISLFFIGDKFIYIGYARWNLFLLPMILLFSIEVIKNLKYKSSRIIVFIIFALIIIISNIVLMPTSVGGVKKSNWGSPLTNTAEYTYPIEEAFKWLKNEERTKHLLITGYNYPAFSEDFYMEKYSFDLDKFKADRFIPKKIKYVFFNESVEHTLLYDILQDLANSYNFTNKSKFILFDQTNVQHFSTVDTIIYFSLNNIELKESSILLDKFRIEKKISNKENVIYIIRPLNFVPSNRKNVCS